ncbi:hypothetical protein DFS34DRAFT_30418 [Phlyctochytrium arcticum]|nr:hypothetical protein DFS34DRAFT_30418 [Phlyctochytrium arcticum]
MTTDGHSCSFVCSRPKRSTTPLTPSNVSVTTQTIFKAVDPGHSDVVTVYEPQLKFEEDDSLCSRMPSFEEDFKTNHIKSKYPLKPDAKRRMRELARPHTATFSGREWAHSAGHNYVDKLRLAHKKAFSVNTNVDALQSIIPSAKTVNLARFRNHLSSILASYSDLRAYHAKEANWRFFKHIRLQKTLHALAKRVKGPSNAHRARSEIVVAYGAAQFNVKRGGRGAPHKAIRQHLSRHVTLVLVNEHRTSRVCYKCRITNFKEEGDVGEKGVVAPVGLLDEEQEEVVEELDEPDDDDNAAMLVANKGWDVRAQLVDSNNSDGPTIYAVRHCPKCETNWNRDVNAAGNIGFVFWYERCNGAGRRPLGYQYTGFPSRQYLDLSSRQTSQGLSEIFKLYIYHYFRHFPCSHNL